MVCDIIYYVLLYIDNNKCLFNSNNVVKNNFCPQQFGGHLVFRPEFTLLTFFQSNFIIEQRKCTRYVLLITYNSVRFSCFGFPYYTIGSSTKTFIHLK
jgi:hypothetical protein